MKVFNLIFLICLVLGMFQIVSNWSYRNRSFFPTIFVLIFVLISKLAVGLSAVTATPEEECVKECFDEKHAEGVDEAVALESCDASCYNQ